MTQKELSKGQVRFAKALEKAMIHKNEATVLAYLAKNEDAKSIENFEKPQ